MFQKLLEQYRHKPLAETKDGRRRAAVPTSEPRDAESELMNS